MTDMGDIVKYYFSLQYSAIQKTVLRHDRLWSISGMSQILAWMNEIAMPGLVQGGNVLVAGGGKFTARFYNKEAGEKARKKIINLISTNLPMLEFQASEIVAGENWESVKGDDVKKGVLNSLNDKKKEFRGYGVSYNPHFRVCPECGEYPAINRPEDTNKDKDDEDDTEDFCHICFVAREKAIIHKNKLKQEKEYKKLTTLERIYKKYFEYFELYYDVKNIPKIPLDFKNLYPDKEEKGLRMAVWFSDLNNMKEKVSIWLSQPEKEIPVIFKMIKDVNIEVISKAIIETFGQIEYKPETCLPFRLIVAGGDDLRIVMAEEYIFDFIANYSSAVEAKTTDIDNMNCKKETKNKDERCYLNTEWLQDEACEWARENKKEATVIKPYSFGGSFVVTSTHTPFKKIHDVCDELMSKAKEATERRGNSVNWRVLSVEDNPSVREIIKFEKPLFIDNPPEGKKDNLTFKEYVCMRRFYHGRLSGSHAQQIAAKIIDFKNDSKKVEDWLKKQASTEFEKSYSYILVDPKFRKENGDFVCERLATLLELLSISDKTDKGDKKQDG